jgi:hypothetical protein
MEKAVESHQPLKVAKEAFALAQADDTPMVCFFEMRKERV